MKEFNYPLFSKKLREAKYKKGEEYLERVTIRNIADELKLPISTIHRGLHEKELEVNTIIKLCEWMDQDISAFVKDC